jgi:hypothetical protein
MAAGPAELINSVIFDCQDGFVHHNPADGEFHIAANTFIQGPTSEDFTPLYFDDEEPGGSTYWLFQNEVRAPGLFEGVVDDISGTALAENAFAGATAGQVVGAGTDFGAGSTGYIPISTQTAAESYEAVLAQAGTFPRDALTNRTIEEVRQGGGQWGADEPDDLLEGLSTAQAPADDDRDGMADDWEEANGLDPDDGDDHSTTMPSGYTAIEEYINGLAEELTGAPPPASLTPAVAEGGSQASPAASGDTDEPGVAASAADGGDGGGDASTALAAAAAVLAAVAAALSGYAVFVLRQLSRGRVS